MAVKRKILGRFNRLRRKVVREKLPPESIAAGWALGMFIGCSVPFGLQLIIVIPLAIMMRVSKIGATLATFITNPFTIFIIYPAQTYVVNKLLFGGSLTFERLMELKWEWRVVRRLGAEAMASFFLGGIFLAIIMTPLTYFTIKCLVVRARERHARKVAASAARQAAAEGSASEAEGEAAAPAGEAGGLA